MRLRQLVLVAESLEPLASDLRYVFGLGPGYNDPGVSHFGLENVVFALGDTFLEIVAPVQERTAAGRYLERRGAGGYMVIVQVPEIEQARARVEGLGIRTVWHSDHEDISASHLHPKDTGGAILSLDEARPDPSWRWAGPNWEEEGKASEVRGLQGATLQSPVARELAERWAAILGADLECLEDQRIWRIALGGSGEGTLDFVPESDGRGEGLASFSLDCVDAGVVLRRAAERGASVDGHQFELGGVHFAV